MLAANFLGDSLLLWFVFNGLFLWTPIYQNKRDLIDSVCDTACHHLTTLKQKIDAVIPKYKE